MSQFLIVHGEEPAEVSSLFDAGMRLFRSFFRPSSWEARVSQTLTTRMARFPMRRNDRGGLVDLDDGTWLVGVGTWFHEKRTGAEALAAMPALERAAPHLDGIFALLRADAAAGDFEIMTDRIGSMHVYERTVGSCLIYSTSSLVLASLAETSWDLDSCREFLAMGTVFEDRTLFLGVRRLAPASIYRIGRGRVLQRRTYWDLSACLYPRASAEGSVSKLAEALIENTGIITNLYPHPAVDLTGGLDSRAIAGALLKCRPAFAAVVVGTEADADVRISARITTEFGLQHIHRRPLSNAAELWERAGQAIAACDGEYNALSYATILDVHSNLSERFDISVNGSNGEICKGYWWEVLKPNVGAPGHFNAQRVAALRFTFEGDAGLLQPPPPDDIATYFAHVIERCNAGLEEYPNTSQLDHVYLRLRMRCWQGRLASSTIRLWPCASPFMWRNVMEIALSTAPDKRLRQRMTRELIETLNTRLAALPTTDGGPALPLRVSTLPRFYPWASRAAIKALNKAGLVRRNAKSPPVVQHLWGLEEVRDLLDPAAMLTVGLYSPERLSAFLTHSRTPEFGHIERFGRLLTLEMVARRTRRERIEFAAAL